jgi:hypothetical protein
VDRPNLWLFKLALLLLIESLALRRCGIKRPDAAEKRPCAFRCMGRLLSHTQFASRTANTYQLAQKSRYVLQKGCVAREFLPRK